MSLWEATDRLCYAAAASAIVHRLGSLLNSELVGVPTDGTWGVRFPHFDGAFVTSPPLRHPTPLYEVLFGLGVLATVTVADRVWGKERRPRGALTGVLLVVYFAGRLLLAPLRESEGDGFSLPFNFDQALSFPFLLLGALLLFRSLRHRAPAGWLLPANTPQS
jgi:prolipoprotein diacylglyceryltransferase